MDVSKLYIFSLQRPTKQTFFRIHWILSIVTHNQSVSRLVQIFSFLSHLLLFLFLHDSKCSKWLTLIISHFFVNTSNKDRRHFLYSLYFQQVQWKTLQYLQSGAVAAGVNYFAKSVIRLAILFDYEIMLSYISFSFQDVTGF